MQGIHAADIDHFVEGHQKVIAAAAAELAGAVAPAVGRIFAFLALIPHNAK